MAKKTKKSKSKLRSLNAPLIPAKDFWYKTTTPESAGGWNGPWKEIRK